MEKTQATQAAKTIKLQKTRLLIASDSTLPRLDGISIFLTNIVPRLKGLYDITLLAPRFGKENWENKKNKEIKENEDNQKNPFLGVNKVYTKMSFFKAGDYPIPIPSLKKIKNEVQNADLIFVQSIGPIGLLAIRYAKHYNKKVVTYIHSIEFELWMKSIKYKFLRRLAMKIAKKTMNFAYKRSDYLLIPSQEVHEILASQKIKTRMQVVPVGVDTKRFIPAEDKEDAKLGLKERSLSGKFVIGYVGRIAREKDIITLIEAFEDMEKTHDNIVLLIVGTGLEEKLKQEVTSKNVIFAGRQEDVLPYLQAMDVFVLPSLTKTSSLSTLEAMSCGLPVVATPVGILKDLIEKGENGFLFPKSSIDSLIAILETLMKSEALRKKIGRNARITIKQNFNWDITAEKIVDVLRKV